MTDDDRDAQTFLDVALSTLGWVYDLGFEDLERRVEDRGFLWRLWSPDARIWVGATPWRREASAGLGPSVPKDKRRAGIGGEQHVPLEAMRHAHGLPVVRPSTIFGPEPGDGRAALQRFGAYLGGLEDLRATELAGDWSRYDAGRAAVAELRRTAAATWRA